MNRSRSSPRILALSWASSPSWRRPAGRHDIEPARAPSAARPPPPRPPRPGTPEPTPIVTPAPVITGPGPNGGVVVRWFIGLGAGTQPAQIGPEQAFITAYNASQKDVYIQYEIVDNTQAATILKTEIAAGQRAGHHRSGGRRGPQPVRRSAA